MSIAASDVVHTVHASCLVFIADTTDLSSLHCSEQNVKNLIFVEGIRGEMITVFQIVVVYSLHRA